MSDIKAKKVVLELILSKSRFWEKKRGEKGEKLGFCKRSSLGWVCFPSLAPKRSNNLEEKI